jgi:hypothetical protein
VRAKCRSRLALGATREQLVRHLLMESLLFAAGGISGCILAWWTIRSLGALDLPIVVDLSLDYRVVILVVNEDSPRPPELN